MPRPPQSPVVLVVLDGWGYRPEREGNAIAMADTPTWDALWGRAPRTLLEASGLAVGLPEGQMGNSEVGHLNLGAGRVVMQDLVRIGEAIRSGGFFRNDAFLSACRRVKRSGGTLHLAGLIGNGGVHAIDRHLVALIDLAEREQIERVAIHAFLDGRDTLPKSALGFMRELLAAAQGRARVASVSGRYFAMDRDKRWERTELAYRAIVEGRGPTTDDPLRFIRDCYERGRTDEFIEPAVVVDASRARSHARTSSGLLKKRPSSIELVMRTRSCITTRPAPRFRCPTSLLPIWPSGNPTARPEAVSSVRGELAQSASQCGVFASAIALAVVSSR